MKDFKTSSIYPRIDIRDEKEFKLWIKFIASVYKSGGDIKKPSDILWQSVLDEIRSLDQKCRTKSRSFFN